MAAFLTDSFTSASGSVVQLENHTPDTGGGAWVQAGSLFGASNSGTMQIRVGENYTRTTLTTNYVAAYHNVLPPHADTKVQGLLGRSGTASASVPGLIVRADPTGNNCYYIRCTDDTTTLYKIVGGTRTTLAATPAVSGNSGNGVPNNSFAIFTLEAKGNTVTVTRNSVQLLQVTDNSILANGYVGVISTSQGYVDDLAATDTFVSIVSGDASMAGTGAFNAAGVGTVSTTASMAGTVATSFVGASFGVGFWNSDGVGALAAVGLRLALITADATIAGSSTASFGGTGINGGSFSIGGAATDDLISDSLFLGETEMSIEGSSSLDAEGSSIGTGAFSITGSATNTIRGGHIVVAAFSADGTSDLDGSSSEPTPEEPVVRSGTVSAAGTSSTFFEPYEADSARLRADGDSTTSFRGASTREAAFAAEGRVGLSYFDGTGIIQSDGIMGGSATVVFRPVNQAGPPPDERTVFITPVSRVATVALESRLIVMTTPPSRTVAVPAEDRDAIVPTEPSRVMIIEAESRSAEVPVAESRIAIVPYEDRSVAA